jgi:CheY-specific phosphatase CheX
MSATIEATMPPELVSGVVEGIKNTFDFLKETKTSNTGESNFGDGLLVMMSFAGTYRWSFGFILPKETAVAFCTQFTGFEFPYESLEMGECMGEFANVIAGEVCSQLAARGVDAKMGLPTVARGTDLEIIMPESQPTEKVYMAAPSGRFVVKITMAKCTNSWIKTK